MTTQPQLEMLPKTQLEIANIFLSHFEDEVEKTSKAMLNAQARVAEALKLREMAEHEVARHAGENINPVVAAALDMKRTAEESGTRVTLSTDRKSVTFGGKPVDPITGEVDETTGELDPITAEGLEAITGEVYVTYPGEDHACTTDVGSRTQYGELVADYLATLPAVSSHHDDPVAYYCVMGVDDGLNRDLRGPVAPDDYGVELAVVRLVDVQEANELLEDAVR